MFLTKNVCHHETLASKNDNNSYKLLLYFYNIFLIIWPLNFFRVAHFDVRKAGSLTYGPEDRKICQSTPDRNPATVISTGIDTNNCLSNSNKFHMVPLLL